jgi:hypothetical protein
MPSEGERVLVPNPAGGGSIVATFERHGDEGDALRLEGHIVDVGWVRYEEGEEEGAVVALPYRDITSTGEFGEEW